MTTTKPTTADAALELRGACWDALGKLSGLPARLKRLGPHVQGHVELALKSCEATISALELLECELNEQDG